MTSRGRMLDPAYVRDHMETVRSGLRNRGLEVDKALEDIATLETARRRLIPELEGLKRQQNASGDEIARARRQGKEKDALALQEAGKQRAAQIKQLGFQLDSVEHQREVALLHRFRAGHEDLRRALLGVERRRRSPGARAHQLHARSPHERARLPRDGT